LINVNGKYSVFSRSDQGHILIRSAATVHVPARGPWVNYYGHLEAIPQKYLIGAVNIENGGANEIKNQITSE